MANSSYARLRFVCNYKQNLNLHNANMGDGWLLITEKLCVIQFTCKISWPVRADANSAGINERVAYMDRIVEGFLSRPRHQQPATAVCKEPSKNEMAFRLLATALTGDNTLPVCFYSWAVFCARTPEPSR